MKLPIGATVLTLIVIPVLIALGVWQLDRREWKRDLVAQLATARVLPPVEPREFTAAMAGETSLQFRRAEIDCRPGRVKPYDVKGGTSARGVGGFLILANCNDPARPRAPDLVVVAGWTVRPDAVTMLDLDTSFAGTLIEKPYGDATGRPQFMLIPTTAVSPLAPSRVPVPDDLPDNHLSYALQWFAFAVTLAVIYGLYAQRWRRERS